MSGRLIARRHVHPVRVIDDDFLVMVNAWWEPLGFTLPGHQARRAPS